MNNTHGCAPIYCAGAILFFAGGGTLIYFDHTIIGAIVMVPGIVLLALALLTLSILFQVRQKIHKIKTINAAPKKRKRKKRK